MKKMLVKIAASVSAAAILVLAGCSTPETPDYNFNTDSKVDTVLNLAAPEVKATAYPGMNFVSWTSVANANGYVLYIYEEGSHVKTEKYDYDAELFYSDTNIQNNKNYKYVVEAESDDNVGRAVKMQNTLSSPVTVKAIVPAYETSPLELYNFESGKNAEYVVSAANINPYKDSDSKIAVSFPSKAYLNYNVYYYLDNEYETYKNRKALTAETLSNKASNNSTLQASTTITSAGTYHFIVDAKAENSKYGKTDTVVSEKTVEVELLKGKDAKITSVVYRDDDTVRVVFDGFKFALDGSIAPADYYKVYRSVNYNPNTVPSDDDFEAPTLYTPVSGTVKATDISSKTFFVEDEIEDNTVAYTYTLVVTDGERFATLTNDMRKIVNAKVVESTFGTTKIESSASCLDNDEYDNDIEWTITLPDAPATGIALNAVYYLEKDPDEKHTVVAADFVKDAEHKVAFTPAGDTTGKIYKVFTKDHTPGTEVYLLAAISADGYNDAEVVSTKCDVSAHSVADFEFTSLQYDNTVDGTTKADYMRVLNDVVLNIKQDFYNEQLDDFEFEIYETKPASITTSITNEKSIIWDFETVDWKLDVANTAFKEAGLKKNAYKEDQALNEYCAVVELSDLEPGYYAWKLVRTNKVTGEVVTSQIETAVVAGQAPDSIKFQPTITANRVDPDVASSAVKITFTKNNTPNEYIEGTTGKLKGLNVGVVSEKEETGVTYSVYRTTIAGNKKELTKLVWKFVGKVEITDYKSIEEDDSKYCYRLDDNEDVEGFYPTYVDIIDYSFTDKELSTGDGYTYIVVCEKDGCETVYSTNHYTIEPIN